MFGWLRKLWLHAQARAARLEMLEQQAHTAKEQLNASLRLAVSASSPERQVAYLELAQSQFAALQAIAAEHPKMRLTNAQEVDAAIRRLEAEFSRAGYYARVQASRRQSASAHVSLSPQAKDLLR